MTLHRASDDVYDRGPKTEDGLVGMQVIMGRRRDTHARNPTSVCINAPNRGIHLCGSGREYEPSM